MAAQDIDVFVLDDGKVRLDDTARPVRVQLPYGAIRAPKGVDVDKIRLHLDRWRAAYEATNPFSDDVRPEVVVVGPDAIGTAGRLGIAGPGAWRLPVMWDLRPSWQRNLWYLTHECAELLLKLERSCPRWFVEGFAQLHAYVTLGRIARARPLATAVQ